MIAAKMRKSTFHYKDLLLTEKVENTLLEALHVGYGTVKEEGKTLLIYIRGQIIVDIMQ